MGPAHSLEVLFGALAGTLISVGIARFYLIKSLKDLETALNMCNKINERLAGISIKIEVLDRVTNMVYEHDRKIITLEQRRGRGN